MPWVKPEKEDVKSVLIYTGAYGFRYSCRDADGKVVWEAPHPFRSRYDAREAVKKSWPGAKISMEVG